MATVLVVHGLRETLLELRNYDKSLYQTVAKDMKDDAQPFAAQVGNMFPVQPLRYWHSTGGRLAGSRFPSYNAASVRSGVKPIVSTVRRGNQTNILRIQQMNAGGAVYDSAGGGSSNRLSRNLDKHASQPSVVGKYRSRVMFGAVKRLMPQIQLAVQKSIDKTDLEIRRRLAS
jgi:hypothetical protein